MGRVLAAMAFAVAMVVAAGAQTVIVEFRPAADAPREGLVEMTSADGMVVHVAAEPILTNADIAEARADVDPYAGLPVINLSFTEEGGAKFADCTRDNVLGLIAIVIDGVVVSAPRINEPILGGRATISGNFTVEEAERIAHGIVPPTAE